jgi:hypothetical protein
VGNTAQEYFQGLWGDKNTANFDVGGQGKRASNKKLKLKQQRASSD